MSSRHALIASFAMVFTLLVSVSSASAQNPWSPIKPNPSVQVTDGVFAASPLRLPFTQVSVVAVAPENSEQPSQDFEHVYNAPYAEVVEFFNGEEARKDGHEVLDANAFPESKGYKLRTSGSGDERNGMFFRLSHREISRDILVLVEPRGSQTVVTFRNVVITNISSGVMPARQGFLGVNFREALPFNWN